MLTDIIIIALVIYTIQVIGVAAIYIYGKTKRLKLRGTHRLAIALIPGALFFIIIYMKIKNIRT